jgi:cytochrome b
MNIATATMAARVPVWDLAVRICHWLLALAVASAFVTVKIGGDQMMVWHGRAGLAVLGLVVFRIVWGFIGSTHARFASFVRGPAAIRAYLRGQWSGVGHNPLGALAVVSLLALFLVQATTGLFANDDISYQGHLYALVSDALSSRLTGIHKLFEPLLIGLVAIHVAAIGYYLRIKQTNLVRPMITGWKDVADPDAHPRRGGGLIAFLVAGVIAGAVVYAASGALLPHQTPVAAETPAW